MFHKNAGVLKNFTDFTGKHLCQSFFSKIALNLLNRYSPNNSSVRSNEHSNCKVKLKNTDETVTCKFIKNLLQGTSKVVTSAIFIVTHSKTINTSKGSIHYGFNCF